MAAGFALSGAGSVVTVSNPVISHLYFADPEGPGIASGFFAGSLLHDMERKRGWKRTVKQLVGNPKQIYRKRMVDELQTLQSRHPELTAKVTITGDFRAG